MRKLNKSVWPYQIVISDELDRTEVWCREHLGRRFRDWYSYNTENGRLYAFTDSETLLVFKLRWKYKGLNEK